MNKKREPTPAMLFIFQKDNMSSKQKILILFFCLLFFEQPWASQETLINSQPMQVDSIAVLEKEIQKPGNNFALKIRLGNLYLQNEQFDEAEELFNKLIADDSLAVEAITGSGLVNFSRQPSKIIPFERIKEMLKIDFRSRAIKKFKQALAIDSTYLPARYYLAQSYLRKSDVENLAQAEKEFKYLLGVNPNYRDLTYQLGVTFQKKKEYHQALTYFNRISEKENDYARARIRMSETNYEIQNYEQCTLCYYQAMQTLTDKETLDYLFEEQKMLLTDQEKKEFEAAPYDKKRNIFFRFWKSRDPDPSTVENERLTEHVRRTDYARKHFHFTAPPYYDDRGKIFIKYGAPDSYFNSPTANIPAKDNESWSYESIAQGLVFDFVADGGYYHLATDLTEAAMPGYSFDQRLYLASSLYQDRSHLSDAYSRLASSFSLDQLNDFHIAQSDAIKKYPGDVYSPKEAEKVSFPFLTNWAQFRGEDDKARVEFYTSFPGAALTAKQITPGKEKFIDFFIEADDSNFATVFTDKKRLSFTIQEPVNLNLHHFIFQNNYQLVPGNYSLAFVLEDVESKIKGIKRRNIEVQDFSGDSLLMSNLQLADNIVSQSAFSNLNFTKNGLEVCPYTFKRVLRRRPIFLYFEIYNLRLNERGLSNFEIAYQVETTNPKLNLWQKTWGRLFGDGKKNMITTSMKRVGETTDTIEYFALDFQNMNNGDTQITVKITDEKTQQSAQSAIHIMLID